jgi:hypothetical protein
VTRLGFGRFIFRFQPEKRDFSLLRNVPTRSETDPGYRSVYIGDSFSGAVSGLGVNLATQLYVAPRLKVSGDMPLLPVYVCISCAGLNFPDENVEICTL